MELTFSPAEVQDIDTVYTLSKTLIDQYEDIASIDYPKVLNWVRRKIENHIEAYVCVFCDGQKAGFYRFTPAEHMMELDDLYILPEFRGRGIGTAVVQKCCAETKLPVMLYVFTRNTGAAALYRRLGFRVTQTIGSSRCMMIRDIQEAL